MSDPLRIAVSGAQGTGKTTLARALAERLRLPLLSEVARTVAREMGIARDEPIKPELAMRFQLAIAWRQLNKERRLWRSGFVADRSIVDQVSYLLLKAAAYYNETGEISTVYDILRRTILRAERYSLVVIVPTGDGPIYDDGFRSVDWHYQQIIHELISAHVKAWCPRYHVVPAEATVEERVESVLARITEMGLLGGDGDAA